MTQLLSKDGSVINFSNAGIEPPNQCFNCKSKNLTHDFSAGHFSNEYSASTCNECGAEKEYALGIWVTKLKDADYVWNWPENHPLNPRNV